MPPVCERVLSLGLSRWCVRRLAGLIVAAGMVALLSHPAHAQIPGLETSSAITGVNTPEATVPERQSVSQRARPDYDALGLRAGSFLMFPSVDVQEEYNSNVFVTETKKKADFFTSLRPALTVASDWNNHALNLHADGDIRRYAQVVSENESNFDVAGNGRFDIERNVYLAGGLGYALAHEDRTSPDTVANQKKPTQLQIGSARASYVHESGRIGARIESAVDSYGYNNNVTSTGTTIAETQRDRTEFRVAPRVSYEYIPGYHAFIRAPVNWRDYNATRDPSGFKQNSHGYEVDVGTTVGLGQVVNGEVYVGYFQQSYDDARLKSPSGVDFGGSLLWNVTPLTSVRGSVARTVQETTLQPASSYIESDVGVTVEHELLRNVILTANGTYSNQDYQGVTRTDNVYSGSVGGRYLITRNFSAGLTGTYSRRNSNAVNSSYNQEILLANLRLQY